MYPKRRPPCWNTCTLFVLSISALQSSTCQVAFKAFLIILYGTIGVIQICNGPYSLHCSCSSSVGVSGTEISLLHHVITRFATGSWRSTGIVGSLYNCFEQCVIVYVVFFHVMIQVYYLLSKIYIVLMV